MKYCYYCGTGLEDTMNFCPRCGKKFNEGSDNPEAFKPFTDDTTFSDVAGNPNVESDVKQDEQNNENHAALDYTENTQQESSESVDATQTKKKHNYWWIGVVAVVAVVVIFCLGKFGIMYIEGVSVDIPALAKSVLYLEIYDDEEIIGSASGFLIDDDTLVTNYHVIDGAYNIIAYTDNGEHSAEFSTVLAYDEDLDLAILSGNDDALGVDYFTLADSSLVEQGDKVYVVGYPLGLANTLSEGIVGAVYESDDVTYIQTSAPISQGNSGGPVLNEDGQVIGVTSWYFDEAQNMNYSVSANDVSNVYDKKTSEIELTDLFYGENEDIVDVADNNSQNGNGANSEPNNKSDESYYLKATASNFTVNVGDEISITLEHNCPGAHVFLTADDQGDGRFSQSYKWDTNNSIFYFDATSPGTCYLKFWYYIDNDKANGTIYSPTYTLTITSTNNKNSNTNSAEISAEEKRDASFNEIKEWVLQNYDTDYSNQGIDDHRYSFAIGNVSYQIAYNATGSKSSINLSSVREWNGYSMYTYIGIYEKTNSCYGYATITDSNNTMVALDTSNFYIGQLSRTYNMFIYNFNNLEEPLLTNYHNAARDAIVDNVVQSKQILNNVGCNFNGLGFYL